MDAVNCIEAADARDGDPPLVTVCVPVYNGELFLAQCLDSLLAQSFKDYILLISDNASSDATEEICRRYVVFDPRVRYHRNPKNIGLYGNYNLLLRSVRTPYVKMANADDYWAPAMLRDAVDAMEEDPTLVLCSPSTILVDEHGRETGRYKDDLDLMDEDPAVRFTRVLTKLGLVNQLMGVMRTHAVRAALPLMNQTGADGVFLAELSLRGKILELPEYQYFRRFHRDASSWNRKSEVHQINRVLGEGARRMRFVGWKRHLMLIRIVLRSPVGIGDRMGLLWHVCKQIFWARSALVQEFWQVIGPARDGAPSDQPDRTGLPGAAPQTNHENRTR